MHFRLAHMDDLPQLKAVYRQIIDYMDENKIQIWDEIYPCAFFGDDIENNRLYVLEENETIISAFALCPSSAGADSVKWENQHAQARYIDRLGVRVDYLKKGIGGTMLQKAVALAGEQGAEYVRLFVVDINQPAINLYIKNGFQRADGVYNEMIEEGFVLHEFGFEKKTAR